jgi:hypothetical protein
MKCKLRLPLEQLSESFELYPKMKGEYTAAIQELVKAKSYTLAL